MSPTSYRALPPRGDCRSVPDPSAPVNTLTASGPPPRHVSIPCIGPLAPGGDVLRLDRGDLVDRELVLGELGAQAIEARGVAAEDGALHRAVGRAARTRRAPRPASPGSSGGRRGT